MVAVLLFSCEKEEKKPEDILSEEQMIGMMIDFRIAEGQVATLTLGQDSSINLFRELEKRIFSKHKVDSAIYVKSYQYYMLRPKDALYITDAVIDSLKVRSQKRTSTGKPEDKKPEDQ